MRRDRLEKLAENERIIPGIHNYCDRWCERCPQTLRCLNFSFSEEESLDPETRDIRNAAFWRKLSGIFAETLELLREAGKKWGIDLETIDLAIDTESMQTKDEAAGNHVVCRAARTYSSMVEDWFRRIEELPFETASAVGEGVEIEEAFEVIRWYQYFIAAKVTRAVRGKMEEKEERCGEFSSDSDGSAKIALIAMDRSIGAWAVVSHYNSLYGESVLEIISFLDRLRQAVEKTFPDARLFIRPGFDRMDLNG